MTSRQRALRLLATVAIGGSALLMRSTSAQAICVDAGTAGIVEIEIPEVCVPMPVTASTMP